MVTIHVRMRNFALRARYLEWWGNPGTARAYARASKVRVTDAVLVDPARDIGELFEELVVLPELGSKTGNGGVLYGAAL